MDRWLVIAVPEQLGWRPALRSFVRVRSRDVLPIPDRSTHLPLHTPADRRPNVHGGWPPNQLRVRRTTSTDTAPASDNQSDPGTDAASDLGTQNALVTPLTDAFPQRTLAHARPRARRQPLDMWSCVVS